MKEATSVEQRSVADELLNDSHHIMPSRNAGQGAYRSNKLNIENNVTLPMPSVLNSMLKNTTETGDIGLFSIKPSGLPCNPSIRTASRARSDICGYHHAQTQIPSEISRLFGAPSAIEDGSRQPSFSRNVSSGIMPFCETSSRKSLGSSPFWEDSNKRSYYMALSPFSGDTPSNHHSYTRCESHTDQSEAQPSQRARSAFSYPARLKRPGFRPSSPAVTDTETVDYSRRVEIQKKLPISNNQNKTLRPLSVRSDVNRSTPTTVLPCSFERLPMIERDNVPDEWTNRIRTSGVPPASAEGAMSLTSWNNFYLHNRVPPTAIPESKAPYSSPLYYNYTENFYNEVREEVAVTEEAKSISPLPFPVERTIHEDRELSSDWSYLTMVDLQGRGFLAGEEPSHTNGETESIGGPQLVDICHVDRKEQPSQGASRSTLANADYNETLLKPAESPALSNNFGSVDTYQDLGKSNESIIGIVFGNYKGFENILAWVQQSESEVSQSPQLGVATPIPRWSRSAQGYRDVSNLYFRAMLNMMSSTPQDIRAEGLNPPIQLLDLPLNNPTQRELHDLPFANQRDSESLQSDRHYLQHAGFFCHLKSSPRMYKSDIDLRGSSTKSANLQDSNKGNQPRNFWISFGHVGPCDNNQGGLNFFDQADIVTPFSMCSARQPLPSSTTNNFEEETKTAISLENSTLLGEDSIAAMTITPRSLSDAETVERPTTQHILSKFKMKTRPTIRMESQRLLEEGSLLDKQQRNAQAVTVFSHPKSAIGRPKLKLKVTRASAISLGTVRINRKAAVLSDLEGSKMLGGGDLFTVPPRLACLFRQVSSGFLATEGYQGIEAPGSTAVAKLKLTRPPAVPSNDRRTLEARMHSPNSVSIHLRPSIFFETLSSPYLFDPQQITQGACEPTQYEAVVSVAIPPLETQIWFNDDSSRFGKFTALKTKISGLQGRLSNLYLGTGNRQASGAEARRAAHAKYSFEASRPTSDVAQINTEPSQFLVRPSRKLKTVVKEWLEGVRVDMLGCIKPHH